jgi:hypothetical protein
MTVRPSSSVRALLAALSMALVLVGMAAVALAQTQVVILVRTAGGQPGEAHVTLTPEGGGSPRSCRTSNGTCRMASVPPGRYVVTAEPLAGGRAPIARPVPVPPTQEVTISVTLLE